jgi:hypothetical protein
VTRGMRRKERLPREIQGISTLKSVGTTVRPSFLVRTLLALVGAEAASVIRAFGSDVPPR